MFLILFLMLFVGGMSIGLESFEELLMEEGLKSNIVFYAHDMPSPEERDGVLFYPADVELSEYLAITSEDPYALVNVSGSQFDTYSYRDGISSLKHFDQPNGMHSELLLDQTDLNTFEPSGVHAFLIYSNVSESKEYADIVRAIPHKNVTKHCFDLSQTSYGMDFETLPAIGVFSPLWTHLIVIQEPVSAEFVSHVLNDTFDLMDIFMK